MPGDESGLPGSMHLADVLAWQQARGGYSLPDDVVEVARVALKINVAREGR